MNGAFVLTETFPGSGLWTGAGPNYTTEFGEDLTRIEVSCDSEQFIIDYRGVGSDILFFNYIHPTPPSFADLPNDKIDCDSSFGHDGTATMTCGG